MKTILNLFFSLLAIGVLAQEFDVETLMNNGPTDKRINFVYMGDGYTAAEQDLFLTNAQDAIDAQFNFTPYQQYANFFNAFAIKVISNESGTDHPQTATDGDPDCALIPVMEVDTYFNSTFDAYGIHRLIIPGEITDPQYWDFPAVAEVLITNTPFYDQGSVLVNTPHYGGSGGLFATVSVDVNANFMMIHEIGHSFADLKDEYWAGEYYAAEKANMTQESNPSEIKWKNWLGDEEVGIYPHGSNPPQSEWFRPHQACMMRALNNTFCAVCVEATIDKIYTLVSPIDSYSPTENINYNEEIDLDFSLDLVYPNPNTLNIVWTLDGETYAEDTENISLTAAEITDNHVLIATVEDVTPLSRSYNFINGYLFSVVWKINNTVGLSENTVQKLLFKAYPNPTNEILVFDYTAENIQEEIQISIADIQGKEVLQQSFMPVDGKNQVPLNVSQLASGTYVLQIKTTAFKRSFKFIKE